MKTPLIYSASKFICGLGALFGELIPPKNVAAGLTQQPHRHVWVTYDVCAKCVIQPLATSLLMIRRTQARVSKFWNVFWWKLWQRNTLLRLFTTEQQIKKFYRVLNYTKWLNSVAQIVTFLSAIRHLSVKPLYNLFEWSCSSHGISNQCWNVLNTWAHLHFV